MNYKYFLHAELSWLGRYVQMRSVELNHGWIFQREMFYNVMECFSQGDDGNTTSVFIEKVQ